MKPIVENDEACSCEYVALLPDCLYWQSSLRKFMRPLVAEALLNLQRTRSRHYRIFTCPEAMGVNVTETMAQIGIHLEWPPRQTTRMIYLAGVLR